MTTVFALAETSSAATAGIVSLQGILAIFGVLALLWLAVSVMRRLIYGAVQKDKQAPSAPTQTPPSTVPAADEAEEPALMAAIAAAIAAEQAATVAAITAAITAYRASEGCTGGFRVVSFRRADAPRRRR